MPEQALPGTVTNTAQPIVVLGGTASETEVAGAGRAVHDGTSVTVVGGTAVE